jgi:hypothetical protein
MPAYQLDPLYPDVLRCTACREAVANVADPACTEDPPGLMTARQAVRVWPGAARELVTHDLVCVWRQRDAEARRAGAAVGDRAVSCLKLGKVGPRFSAHSG